VEQLSDAHLLVRLDRRDDDVRTASLFGHGDAWSARLTDFAKAAS
jgi:tRNA threonylcarbamoyladenosine biosynthesis protein TsaE